jgi:MFS family permease
MSDTVVAKKTPSKSYGWVVLIVVFLAGTTAPVNMAKPIAMAPVVMEMFGVGQDVFGWIISMFYVLGFIMAFPAAAIVNRLGIRKVVFICLALGIVGSAFGALSIPSTVVEDIATTGVSSGNLPLFLLGRFLEGCGMGFMGVAGASAIAPWFPKEKRGLPMGIWSCWVSFAICVFQPIFGGIVGGATITEGAMTGVLIPESNPSIVWWLSCVYAAVILVIFFLFYRDAPKGFAGADFEEEVSGDSGLKKNLIMEVLKNPIIWTLGLIFLFDEFAFMAGNGVFMSYLTGGGAIPSPWAHEPMTLPQATQMASIATLMGLVAAPLIGLLSDKLKSRKKILIVGLLVGVAFTCLTFVVGPPPWKYVLVLILGALTGAMVPFAIWSSVPEVVKREHLPAANGFVSFTQNFGMTFGSIALGAVLTATQSWLATALIVMTPLYVICIIIFFAGRLWSKIR